MINLEVKYKNTENRFVNGRLCKCIYECCSIIFTRYSRCCWPGYRVGSSRPLGAYRRCGDRHVSLHLGKEITHDAFELTKCRTIFSPGLEEERSEIIMFSEACDVSYCR